MSFYIHHQTSESNSMDQALISVSYSSSYSIDRLFTIFIRLVKFEWHEFPVDGDVSEHGEYDDYHHADEGHAWAIRVVDLADKDWPHRPRQTSRGRQPPHHNALKYYSTFHVIFTYSSRYLRKKCLFSEFLGNESERVINKSREPWSGSQAICLFHVRIHSSWTQKEDTHSLYLQCFQQRPLLKFSEKHYKFKIPTVTCI